MRSCHQVIMNKRKCDVMMKYMLLAYDGDYENSVKKLCKVHSLIQKTV